MPLYEFKCGHCGHADDEFRKIGNYAPVENCPQCGAFEYIKQVSMVGTDLKAFHTPVKLYSVACNSMKEIRDMQAAGVPCSDDPNDEDFGVPIATNRKEKLAALKTAGFIETK